MIQQIAFLGNYGTQYEKTRHNVAWLFCQSLPFYSSLNWQKKFSSDYAQLSFEKYIAVAGSLKTNARKNLESIANNIANTKLYFQKPLTYMNNSGQAVSPLATFFKIPIQNILVIHDELELPFGTISLKYGGGLGGHNGLRSCRQELGGADFWRLRFGISKPQNQDIADYVLSPFSKQEVQNLPFVFAVANDILSCVLQAKDPNPLVTKYSKIKVDLS